MLHKAQGALRCAFPHFTEAQL